MAAFNEEARARRELENTSNPLLKLPAELRNRIYILALGIDSKSTIRISDKRDCSDWFNERPLFPAILHSSRRFRQETIPIWYGAQDFTLRVSGREAELTKWLNTLPTGAIQSLRSLYFYPDASLSHTHGDGVPHVSTWFPYIELRISGKDEGLGYRYYCITMCYDGPPRSVVEEDCEVAKNVGARARRILKHMRKRVKRFGGDEQMLRRCDLLNLVQALRIFWPD